MKNAKSEQFSRDQMVSGRKNPDLTSDYLAPQPVIWDTAWGSSVMANFPYYEVSKFAIGIVSACEQMTSSLYMYKSG